MYINLPNSLALASNWREAGVHNRRSFNAKDYPTLGYCAIQLQEFPDKLRKYGWDAYEEKTVTEDDEFLMNELDETKDNIHKKVPNDQISFGRGWL